MLSLKALAVFEAFGLPAFSLAAALQNCEFQGCWTSKACLPKAEVLGKPLSLPLFESLV
jgi:hypothetical protein